MDSDLAEGPRRALAVLGREVTGLDRGRELGVLETVSLTLYQSLVSRAYFKLAVF